MDHLDLKCSRGRVALLLHGLHGALQRPLQRQQLAGGLSEHEPGDELAQHAGTLVLLEEARETGDAFRTTGG